MKWLVACILLAGCTLEQVQLGQWYIVTTPPDGACPQVEWHFAVLADRSIGGYLAHNAATRFASLNGALATDDSFHMHIDGRYGSADATGRIDPVFTTIAVTGPGMGPGCDGKVFRLRLGRYFQGQTGRFGGGGPGR